MGIQGSASWYTSMSLQEWAPEENHCFKVRTLSRAINVQVSLSSAYKTLLENTTHIHVFRETLSTIHSHINLYLYISTKLAAYLFGLLVPLGTHSSLFLFKEYNYII